MAKPRGHSSKTAYLRERAEALLKCRAEMQADLESRPATVEPTLRRICACGATLDYSLRPVPHTVYRLKCLMCPDAELAVWDEGIEDIKNIESKVPPEAYSGEIVEIEPRSWTLTRKECAWWDALPDEQATAKILQAHVERLQQEIRKLQKRRMEDMENKVRSLNEDIRDLNRLLERILTAPKTLRLRAKEVRAKGGTPHKDAKFRCRSEALSDLRSILLNAWMSCGQKEGYVRPRIASRDRDASFVSLILAEVRDRKRMDKAEEQMRVYRLDEAVERQARADKRGHIAPPVPWAFWLVKCFPPCLWDKGRSWIDRVKLVREDDIRTWPAIHHYVMAFALPGEKLRPVIKQTPHREGERLKTTGTRPVRYAPTVTRHLITWWLASEHGQASSPETRKDFARVLKLLPH